MLNPPSRRRFTKTPTSPRLRATEHSEHCQAKATRTHSIMCFTFLLASLHQVLYKGRKCPIKATPPEEDTTCEEVSRPEAAAMWLWDAECPSKGGLYVPDDPIQSVP